MTERLLSGMELRALSVRSDVRGAAQLAFHVTLLLVGGWLVARSGPWTILPAMLLLGIAEVTLFAPLHETMHLTAFASRRANAIVGWLVSCPSLLNWHFYGAFHLAHHRHTQDPGHDPELSPLPPATIGGYVVRVAAVHYWRARWRMLADCWCGDLSGHPYVTSAVRDRIVFSVRAMSLAMAGSAVLSALLFGWRVPFAFWIGPQLLAQPILRLYLLTEHTLCTYDGNGLTNTRTTLTNPIVRGFMWNMSFHAEHHLYPSIPFHRLPAAHAVLRSRLGALQQGYSGWHVDFVRKMLS